MYEKHDCRPVRLKRGEVKKLKPYSYDCVIFELSKI